jgi:hypothetical protein
MAENQHNNYSFAEAYAICKTSPNKKFTSPSFGHKTQGAHIKYDRATDRLVYCNLYNSTPIPVDNNFLVKMSSYTFSVLEEYNPNAKSHKAWANSFLDSPTENKPQIAERWWG